MVKRFKTVILYSVILFLFLLINGCYKTTRIDFWNEKFNFISEIQPIVFHYYHGILSGSYPDNKETVEINFNDVCKYLGHICLCGAGGYKISEKAIELLRGDAAPLERGDFIIISSRDHTVSDVIAFVLGCSRRNDPEKNQYFIDTNIKASKREYHYYVGYAPGKKATHITYRKNLLVGNEKMDSLWKIELAYEGNPNSVNQSFVELYRNALYEMIKDVLFDNKKELIVAELIDYNEFLSILQKVKENKNIQ